MCDYAVCHHVQRVNRVGHMMHTATVCSVSRAGNIQSLNLHY